MCANLERIIELSTRKIVINLPKILVWDPGPEIRDPEKPILDPGSRVKKAPDPEIGSATLPFCSACLAGFTLK
jgi:hypothetical protein